MGQALMENRHEFVVQGELTQTDSHAERRAALGMKLSDASGRAGGIQNAAMRVHVAAAAVVPFGIGEFTRQLFVNCVRRRQVEMQAQARSGALVDLGQGDVVLIVGGLFARSRHRRHRH